MDYRSAGRGVGVSGCVTQDEVTFVCLCHPPCLNTGLLYFAVCINTTNTFSPRISTLSAVICYFLSLNPGGGGQAGSQSACYTGYPRPSSFRCLIFFLFYLFPLRFPCAGPAEYNAMSHADHLLILVVVSYSLSLPGDNQPLFFLPTAPKQSSVGSFRYCLPRHPTPLPWVP